MTYRVEDAAGRTLAESKDLAALRAQLAPTMQRALSTAAGDVERTALTTWTDVPRSVPAGPGVTGYPALVDEGTTVALRVLPTPQEQAAAMRAGVRRLLLLGIPSPAKAVTGLLTNAQKLALTANPHGSVAAMLDDAVTAAVDSLLGADLPWDAEAFDRLREHVRAEVVDRTLEVVRQVEQVLVLWQALQPQVAGISAAQVDMRTQLGRLVFPGFATRVGAARLPDLVRYLKAIEMRLSRLPADADRDRVKMQSVAAVEEEVASLGARLDGGADEIRWMVEELRVSLFAQGMRTKYPVSEKRIYKAIDALLG
jgi:ATP-dependent helicase HrpA